MGNFAANPVPLADALFGKTKKAVIGILFSKPESPVHLRELARLAHVSAPMMSHELNTLVAAGIVTSRKDGNRLSFQANKSCPIFEELRGISRKTAGVVDVIRNALAGQDIDVTFIFGSVAKGKEGSESDIDLMVIGDIDSFELNGLIAPLEDELRRPIHLSHYGRDEWQTVCKDRIVSKITQGLKIMVIGDDPATRSV